MVRNGVLAVVEVLEEHRELLRRLLPEDESELVVRCGQFHRVVLGRDRVVCFPRTAAAAERLPDRAAVLGVLAGLDLGCHTPEPLVQGADASSSGTPYLVLSRIHGSPLAPDAFAQFDVAAAVAGQYGALLSALAVAGRDVNVRSALPTSVPGVWRRFAAQIRGDLFPMMSPAGRDRAECELSAVEALADDASAVVHGDLGRENVLWETSVRLPVLAGVVDWDGVRVGDPANDLAAIGATYGQPFLEQVLAYTDWSGPEIMARVAAIRGSFALQQALAGHRDGDDQELAAGLANYSL